MTPSSKQKILFPLNGSISQCCHVPSLWHDMTWDATILQFSMAKRWCKFIPTHYINGSQAHPKCHCQNTTHFQPESKASSPIFLNSFLYFALRKFFKSNLLLVYKMLKIHALLTYFLKKKHQKNFLNSPHKHKKKSKI